MFEAGHAFKEASELVHLTDREDEVLICIARGLSNKEAARELGIAPRTVERHVENLRNKIRARNKAHMMAKAIRYGLLNLDSVDSSLFH